MDNYRKYAKIKRYVALIGRLSYPLNPPEGDAQAVQDAHTTASPYFFLFFSIKIVFLSCMYSYSFSFSLFSLLLFFFLFFLIRSYIFFIIPLIHLFLFFFYIFFISMHILSISMFPIFCLNLTYLSLAWLQL